MSNHWDFDRDSWGAELSMLRFRVLEISDYATRRDLQKMFRKLDSQYTEIYREEQRCCISNKPSNRHRELVAEFIELHENFISYMTQGILSL